MKIQEKILALCIVLHPDIAWRTIAFSIHLPKTSTTFKGKTTTITTNAQRIAKSQLYGINNDSYFASLRDASVPDESWSALHSSQSVDSSSDQTPQQPTAKYAHDIWSTVSAVKIQGKTLRTCSFGETAERVQVFMKTDGRPLNSEIDLWQGPDNTPQKMKVYIEDGDYRPFTCIIETPGAGNAIAIRNTANVEFPLHACIGCNTDDEVVTSTIGPAKKLAEVSTPRIVQGGAVYTVPFDPAVKSVQLMLCTDGRPLNARVELIQGPNNNKQVMEVYTEDGLMRPFFVVIETPGDGNVIRILNTATLEYPLSACVEPYLIEEDSDSMGGASMLWS